MAEVAFHFNVPDRLAYACRLLRKVHRLGTAVSVVADPATLDRLDRQLWVFEPMEFVPHVRADVGGRVAPHLADTPVWLVEQASHAPSAHTVLVQLGASVPEGIDRFDRVVEIVSSEPEELQAGRARWRAHLAAGRTLVRHDVGASSPAAGDDA